MNMQHQNPLSDEERYVLGKILETGSITKFPQGTYLVCPLTPMTQDFLQVLSVPGFRNRISEVGNDIPVIRSGTPAEWIGENGSGEVGVSLQEMCNRFLEERKQRGSYQSYMTFDRICRYLVDIIGGATLVRKITRKDILRARRLILEMPMFYQRRFPGMSIEQAVEAAKEQDLPRRNIRTLNQMLIRITILFKWAEGEWLIEKNPALNLVRKPSPSEIRFKRRPFSIEQLNKIFQAPIFTGCIDDEREFNNPGPNVPRRARFWASLMGLFTGLRLGEILQLDVTDIQVIDTVPCISVSHISEDGETDKRIKTPASERYVPIHSELIRIGLLDYVDDLRRNGERKLFPNQSLSPSRGSYTPCMSIWFNQRFLKGVGAYKRETTFHSFRHNFKDALQRAGVDILYMRNLCGWSLSRSTFDYNYGMLTDVAALSGAIEKVCYPELDLSHLYMDTGGGG
ncbi:MAG: site-specific integrase [Rhodospirillales bacterium]|nr:site-specific integrase [Rhodospirillales bacterium]